MRTFIYLFLITSVGCTSNQSNKNKEQTINEVKNINITSLMNYKATILSRDRGDDRIIVTDYYDGTKGAVLLKIDENCNVFGEKYNQWNSSSKLDKSTTELISKCLCEIGLNAISVDSCGNTYFSVSQIDKYEFVMVKNKSCLNNKFKYSRYKDQCYFIK